MVSSRVFLLRMVCKVHCIKRIHEAAQRRQGMCALDSVLRSQGGHSEEYALDVMSQAASATLRSDSFSDEVQGLGS